MKGSHEPRSSSSCAACKSLKRRCTPTRIFAPYFRSDEPKKFTQVHKVFGASNVSKILNEVPEDQRADTVNSLAYDEDEARLIDPVYGCIGAISMLERKMIQLQHDLAVARASLVCYAPKNSPSSSSSCSISCPMLDEGTFPGFPAWSGLNGNNFSQNASELISQHGQASDFSYSSYIL